jgi:sugar phosphate isomerase/epimerase
MYKTIAPGCIGHHQSFKEAADACAKAGFEGYWFGIEGDSALSVTETNEILAKTGLRAAGFNLPIEFRKDQGTFEAGLPKFEEYVKYAAKIGAKRCVTWIISFSDTLPYKENFEIHRIRLKRCCEILREYGMVFGMEFLGPYSIRKGKKYDFIHNLDQILELCYAIGTGNCGILMDVWHWDLAGQTKDDFKKLTNGQVALAHINDAPAGIPAEEQIDSVRGLPGETGVLRIAEFFEGLRKIGYDGPVLAEPFEPKLGQMPFVEALKTVMDSIKQVWFE